MVRRRILRTAIIVGIIAALAILALSFRDINFLGLNRGADGPLGLTLGLDLQGGSYLKYQARFSDEVNVTFSRLPDEATVQTLEVEGALTGQPVIVEAEEDEGNVFGIQAPDATGLTSADLEEDVRGELETLADEKGLIVAIEPTVEATDEGVGFTATFRPKEGFGEDQILAAMRGNRL